MNSRFKRRIKSHQKNFNFPNQPSSLEEHAALPLLQLGQRPNSINRKKQDRKSKYDVTLRCVRATIVVVDKQYVLHILSVYL